MNKVKKLELEIQALKDLVLQLQSQVIALQARAVVVGVSPTPSIEIQPIVTKPLEWPPTTLPYIGDPVYPHSPTITCGNNKTVSGDKVQISRCIQ